MKGVWKGIGVSVAVTLLVLGCIVTAAVVVLSADDGDQGDAVGGFAAVRTIPAGGANSMGDAVTVTDAAASVTYNVTVTQSGQCGEYLVFGVLVDVVDGAGAYVGPLRFTYVGAAGEVQGHLHGASAGCGEMLSEDAASAGQGFAGTLAFVDDSATGFPGYVVFASADGVELCRWAAP